MGSLKALTLAGGVAFAAATAAHAADLPPPPMPEPMPIAAPEYNGWYLRGDVGVGVAESTKLRQSFDAGFVVPGLRVDKEGRGDQVFVGAGLGYQFNQWLRFDATGEYRTDSDYRAIASYTTFCPVGTRCYDNYSGRISSAVFLANMYVDLGNWYGLTPYVGVGVGTARHRWTHFTDVDYQVGGYGFAPDKKSWKAAWALMAGVSYDVTQNLKLELGYRYLNMGKMSSGAIVCQNTGACPHEIQRINMASHDFRLGMRWMFAAPAAPAPVAVFQPPLRSKF
jgi:opacity protein-like surface antigen